MKCIFCEELAKGKELLYADDDVAAVINPKPAVPGHILVFPKKHFQIIEQVPDKIVGKLFNAANELSKVVFETLHAQGTNIILQNGGAAGQIVPHVCLHVIPRFENDGLSFQWKPKQLGEEEMSTIELKIKQCTEKIVFEKEREKPIEIKEEKEEIKAEEGKGDYLLEHIERLP